MDTWLLLYPTTKAWASLKFYTTITLNIQFLNVFTEPAMRYRGAFHLCLKQNPKKKRSGGGGGQKVIGFRCFSYNAGYLSLHNPQTCRAPAAPTPTWGGFQRRWSSCVHVQRRNDRQGRGKPLEEGGEASRVVSLFFFFFWFMSVHVSLKSSKPKAQLKTYICQSWANSDIKCQRARWNTDGIPPRFPPFIFKQMLWVLILLYKFCRKTRKKRGERKKKKTQQTFLRTN